MGRPRTGFASDGRRAAVRPWQQPIRLGYGTRVVRHMVPYELGGTVDLVHAPEGVRCEIELPGRWLSDEVAGDPPSSASTRPGR